MFAVTIDQVASSTSEDAVPHLLDLLARSVDQEHVALAFERTAGDEVQGLLSGAPALREVVTGVLRDGRWRVGIGVGPVQQPLPSGTREASGPAYVMARAAVDRAKGRRAVSRVAVEGHEPTSAAELEAAWHLVATLASQRTEKMWEAIDTVTAVPTNVAAAERLGISTQALSERLRGGGWAAEVAAGPLLDALAVRADGVAAP